ncbi:MFS transporter, DHA3 family, macrolide efflux protein [Paenimyroides ummariense]|uniref:MFS transporter, DHA3 family, macrolide efflux protein n=1 Tax=Paenimyroides ummariense TaxID=913024 RepID=A0A1I5EXU7_9FLAO|nr:MFS transporter [Paenimyroides ummariense]SFO16216.1 MFS transporter, DHA3 family, macrolide efflux protein [Paenimyroides ummariense]
MERNWIHNFTLIWSGQLISLISSSAVNFAVIIWLSLETRSAEVLAYAAIAGLLPQAVLGFIAGVYVDRWNKKKTMIISDLVVSAFTLLLAGALFLGDPNLILIYCALGLRSAGSAFHMPAMQATIPVLAPRDKLVRIAGINQLLQSITVIASPALGALLIGSFKIEYVLLFDVAGAVIAITALLFVKIPQRDRVLQENDDKSGAIKSFVSDFRIGITAVKKIKGLSSLFAVSLGAAFFMIPIGPLLPLMTLEHFAGGKYEISLVEIVWGVGMLLGSLMVTVFKPRKNKIVGINLCNLSAGILLFGAGLLSGSYFAVFVIFMGICGITYSIESSLFNTLLQEHVDEHALGRVYSIYYSIIVLPSVLGLLLTGNLSGWLGINEIFMALGLLVVLIGGVSFFIPALMNLENQEIKH